MTTRLLMQADYFADPLWQRSDDGFAMAMVSLDSLPISKQLRSDLRTWAGRYDENQFSGYEWSSEQEHDSWVDRGRELYTALVAELGPEYDVVFRPEVVG
ncbi:MAG TPA: hypothetical protein VHC49_23475 [Mycobacteriales bacterium]|nr:hypothetical protein [Mycobacteriales bacterium]